MPIINISKILRRVSNLLETSISQKLITAKKVKILDSQLLHFVKGFGIKNFDSFALVFKNKIYIYKKTKNPNI